MPLLSAAPWRAVQVELAAAADYANPYTDLDVWAEFVHTGGLRLRRPAFFDGNGTWRVRFASPLADGAWTWRADATVDDPGLRGVTGRIDVADTPSNHRLHVHGFWRMSRGRRSLVHADGSAALLVADTAWALPWRASEADVAEYAADRQRKGFKRCAADVDAA